jgi:8-oxo-dGTP pyrophosphatase MutT (NUDIX family)
MTRYNDASFPPLGDWDRRLTEVICPDLKPVELLHENTWFMLRKRGNYYTVEYRQPQVVVLPVVDQRAVVMVRVKRPVLDDVTLELPAGGSDGSEAPSDAAAREFAEETGISVPSSRLIAMPPLAVSPNRMPKLVYVFKVEITQQEFDNRGPHDNEIEKVELVPLAEAAHMIATGRIYIAVPIAIICTYLLSRQQFDLNRL